MEIRRWVRRGRDWAGKVPRVSRQEVYGTRAVWYDVEHLDAYGWASRTLLGLPPGSYMRRGLVLAWGAWRWRLPWFSVVIARSSYRHEGEEGVRLRLWEADSEGRCPRCRVKEERTRVIMCVKSIASHLEEGGYGGIPEGATGAEMALVTMHRCGECLECGLKWIAEVEKETK